MTVHRRVRQTSKTRAIIRSNPRGKMLRGQTELGLERNKILTCTAASLVYTKWNKLQFCDQREPQKKKQQEQRRERRGSRRRGLSTFRWHTVLGYYHVPFLTEANVRLLFCDDTDYVLYGTMLLLEGKERCFIYIYRYIYIYIYK
jgi:hypothetical protein